MNGLLDVVSSLVGTSGFGWAFLIVALLFIAGVLLRAFHWAGRVIHLMLALLFIFSLALLLLGSGEAVKAGTQTTVSALLNTLPSYIGSYFAEWSGNWIIGPGLDSFDMYEDAVGSAWKFLCEAGKLFLLALLVNIFKEISDRLTGKLNFIIWLLEATIFTSFAVAVYYGILYALSLQFSQESLVYIFAIGFLTLALVSIVIGILGMCGRLLPFLMALVQTADSFYYSFILKPIVATLLTTALALIADFSGIMREIRSATYQTFGVPSPAYLMQFSFLIWMLIIIWYIVYRMFK